VARSQAPAPGQQPQQQQQQGARPAYPSLTPQRGRGAVPTTLVVTEGRLAGTSLPLTPAGILIGRNPECALVLDDDFASGRHARLIQRNGAWQVEDLGSTNGTQLDGHRLTGAQPVAVGSTLRIGRTTIELRG
jgi:pSer/pThr/pTyr-binding forkhead associated (FHA) protein